MEFRTSIKIDSSPDKIGYTDPVMFIGSCFASSVGSKMMIGNMPVLINPAGTVYNPVSVCNTLDTIFMGKEFSINDLYLHNGNYVSFNHYTDFSSSDPDWLIDKMNKTAVEAIKFIEKAKYLFITFGTARIYRLVETGQIVSNCHKMPSDLFRHELLKADDIVKIWEKQLDRLQSLIPDLKVIFTISPVRHWKDGPHGNQVSKSTLFLAVEELLGHKISPKYFPSYELLMDDLRDYRFYDEDMLHPSPSAINYIWKAFSDCYLEKLTLEIWEEVAKIKKASNHRINSNSGILINDFANRMLNKIYSLEKKYPYLDLSAERQYFITLR